LSIHEISFNAVASTFLQKAIRRLLTTMRITTAVFGPTRIKQIAESADGKDIQDNIQKS
jgi:hypothetical protein